MKKFILFTLGLTLLSGCQSMPYGRTNVLSFESIFFEVPTENQNYVQEVYKPQYGENLMNVLNQDQIAVGVITMKDADQNENDYVEQLQNQMKSLNEKTKISSIVIIQETEYKNNDILAFTYTDLGVLHDQNQYIDQESIKHLTDTKLVQDLGTIAEKSSWNNSKVRTIISAFPQAKIVLLSINKNAPDEYMNTLSHALDTSLSQETVMIVPVTKIESPDQTYRDFYQSYSNEVIRTGDIDHFDELPVSEWHATKLLGYYLRKRASLKLSNDAWTTDTNIAIFKKGPASANSEKIYFVAFGDIMLGRAVRAAMDKNGLEYPFIKMNNDYLRVNDFLIANLEGPVTKNSVRTTTGMSFGFFPDVVPILKQFHFDIVSQANNHTLDKKQSGWEESMENLRDGGIMAFGYPKEINGESVAKLSIRDQKLAFLGLEEVNFKINDEKAVETVKSLINEGYEVIPFIHYGIEYKNKPSERQKELAHKLVDAGAIAIIAHHPHVVESVEIYNGHPIVYSLGNAIFDQYWSAPTQVGLSIGVELSQNEIKIYLMPIKLPKSQFQLMAEDEKTNFLEEMSTYGDSEVDAVKTGIIKIPLE